MKNHVDLKMDQWAAADTSKLHQIYGESRMSGDVFNPFNSVMKRPHVCEKGALFAHWICWLLAVMPSAGFFCQWFYVEPFCADWAPAFLVTNWKSLNKFLPSAVMSGLGRRGGWVLARFSVDGPDHITDVKRHSHYFLKIFFTIRLQSCHSS